MTDEHCGAHMTILASFPWPDAFLSAHTSDRYCSPYMSIPASFRMFRLRVCARYGLRVDSASPATPIATLHGSALHVAPHPQLEERLDHVRL